MSEVICMLCDCRYVPTTPEVLTVCTTCHSNKVASMRTDILSRDATIATLRTELAAAKETIAAMTPVVGACVELNKLAMQMEKGRRETIPDSEWVKFSNEYIFGVCKIALATANYINTLNARACGKENEK